MSPRTKWASMRVSCSHVQCVVGNLSEEPMEHANYRHVMTRMLHLF